MRRRERDDGDTECIDMFMTRWPLQPRNRRHRWFGLAFALILLLSAAPAVALEIWFAPVDHLKRADRLKNQDFPDLFNEPPGWNTRVDVFKIAPFFAAKATEQDLRRVADFVKRHRMRLAVAVQPTQVTNECALGEGRVRPRQNLKMFSRLHALGVDVAYIGLDEPLTFAHYPRQDPRPCLFPIPEVARRVAATIAEIRQFYPDAKVVDFEYPSITRPANWAADLKLWLDEYKAATGTPLYAVVLDVNWREPWADWVRPSIEVLHRNGVKAGMFLTIAGPGTSDEGAVASLRDNIQAVDAANLRLDLEILATWTFFPTRSLPASDPRTLTSVLDWYLQRRGRGQ